MKKFTATFIIILFIGNSILSAQKNNADSRREKIETQRIAFITQKVNFTIKEAQNFWPVYNELSAKKKLIFVKKMQIKKQITEQRNELSDNELIKLSDDFVHIDLQLAKLNEVYHQKFKIILPIKKLLKYYIAEEQYKRVLVREIRESGAKRKQKF